MPPWLPMVLSFAVSALLSAAVAPLARCFGERNGWYRLPGGRHKQPSPVPRSGGLALAAGTTAGLLLLLLLPIPRPTGEFIRIGLLIAGALLAFALMLRDEFRELPALVKLAVQIGVAAVAILPWWLGPTLQPPPGFLITQVQNPFGGTIYLTPAVAVLFSFFWFAGMMNTTNLLDGLDGLAAGVTAIAAVFLFIHFIRLGQLSLAPLPLAVAGACLGFLPLNFYPARLYMGDSGAIFLGYCLAVLAIIGGAKMATALLVLGVPIVDVAWVIIFRLVRGHSPTQADRGHLHHRLQDMGLSQPQVAGLFYGLSTVLGILAILLPSGRYKLIVLVMMALGLGAFLWWLAKRGEDDKVTR